MISHPSAPEVTGALPGCSDGIADAAIVLVSVYIPTVAAARAVTARAAT